MVAQIVRETVIARMKPEPKALQQEVLAGLVERVTFRAGGGANHRFGLDDAG